MAIVHAMAHVAVKRDLSGSLAVALPATHLVLTAMTLLCAVTGESVGVVCAYVRTIPYEVAPNASCVR